MENEAAPLVRVRRSRPCLGMLLFGALAFFALGCGLIWQGLAAGSGPLATLLGLLAVLFFGGCALGGGVRLLDTRSALVITPEGVTDHGSPLAPGFIAWADIGEVAEYWYRGQPFIVLKLNDPEPYLRRAGPCRRLVARLNGWFCGSPLAISTFTLACGHQELLTLLRRYHAMARATSPRQGDA